MAPNSPVSTSTPRSRNCADESFVQRNRDLRTRRVDEARPATLGGVAIQRELRHDEHRAADVRDDRFIFSSSSAKRRKPDDLFGHPDQLFLGVGMREADEQQIAAADPAGDPLANPHFAATTRWSENSHSGCTRERTHGRDNLAGARRRRAHATRAVRSDGARWFRRAVLRAHASRRGLANQLDVDRQLDLVADRDAARLERLVPGESEVAAA